MPLQLGFCADLMGGKGEEPGVMGYARNWVGVDATLQPLTMAPIAVVHFCTLVSLLAMLTGSTERLLGDSVKHKIVTVS